MLCLLYRSLIKIISSLEYYPNTGRTTVAPKTDSPLLLGFVKEKTPYIGVLGRGRWGRTTAFCSRVIRPQCPQRPLCPQRPFLSTKQVGFCPLCLLCPLFPQPLHHGCTIWCVFGRGLCLPILLLLSLKSKILGY